MKTTIEEIYRASREAVPTRGVHYVIEPRYTCGSPAMISFGEVAHAAVGEAEHHEMWLTGVFGEEMKKRAETEGLGGIAYGRWTKGKKIFRWDLLTRETMEEPKELSYSERERAQGLQQWIEHPAFSHPEAEKMRAELAALKRRAKIHRQSL